MYTFLQKSYILIKLITFWLDQLIVSIQLILASFLDLY